MVSVVVEHEFRSLTAWRMKLLCCVVAWQWILLYLLPNGSSVNRLWLGCVLSFSTIKALWRHLTSPMSQKHHKWVPVMFLAVFIIHYRALPVLGCVQTMAVCDVSSQDASIEWFWSCSLASETSFTYFFSLLPQYFSLFYSYQSIEL